LRKSKNLLLITPTDSSFKIYIYLFNKIIKWLKENKYRMVVEIKLLTIKKSRMNNQVIKSQNSGKTCKTVNSVFEQMFENQAILTVRDDNDVVWFKAKDVCTILEYKSPKDTIRRHVQKSDMIVWKMLKLKGDFSSPLKIHAQTKFINESGVNSLVMRSKKPNAKKFQHWICSEVIPSIRKSGYYVHEERKSNAYIDDDDYAYFSTLDAVQNDKRAKYLLMPKRHQDADISDIEQINQLLIKGSDIDVFDYDQNQVLYFYVTSIKNLHDNRMICKIGHSGDLFTRNGSLKNQDYKCQMRIVGVRVINGQQNEKKFHTAIKNTYPDLRYNCKFLIGKKNPKIQDKTELYYYSPKLMRLFEQYVPKTQECETCAILKQAIQIETEDVKRKEEEMLLLKQQLQLQKDIVEEKEQVAMFYKLCHEINQRKIKRLDKKLLETEVDLFNQTDETRKYKWVAEKISEDYLRYAETYYDEDMSADDYSDNEYSDDDDDDDDMVDYFCNEYENNQIF